MIHKYPDNPLISSFALESGTVFLIDSTDNSHQNWNNLSTAVGCGSGEKSLECMREISSTKIIETMANASYDFTPIPDNQTFFSDYAARARAGKIAHLVRVSTTLLGSFIS